jgi:multidrug efflux pump subunit AcrA (membrane-fusion protein)
MIVAATALALAAFSACTSKEPTKPAAAMDAEPATAPTNRIDIPLAVRQNLGITFAKVERRPVASTLRYPGRFELDPAARHDHAARVPGTVALRVNVLDRVTKGAPLADLNSPLMAELAEQRALAAIEVSEADTAHTQALAMQDAANDRVEHATQKSNAAQPERKAVLAVIAAAGTLTAHWQQRVKDLQSQLDRGLAVADALAEAEASLREARASEATAARDLAALDTQLKSLELDVAAARTALAEAIAATHAAKEHARIARDKEHASSLRLLQILGEKDSPFPFAGEVVSGLDGVVSYALPNGTFVDTGGLIATVINPRMLNLRVSIPVTDAARLSQSGVAHIQPITGGNTAPAPAPARVTILDGFPAEPGMVEALLTPVDVPAWAMAGLAARAEFTLAGGTETLSIPARATIRDGLDILAFVRDPANPDKVIRQPVTLGASDGVWVEVKSGVGPDDEVVLDGIYELKLTGAGKAEAGGHFHADGTFHAGPDH